MSHQIDVTDKRSTFLSCMHLIGLSRGRSSQEVENTTIEFVFSLPKDIVWDYVDNLYPSVVAVGLRALGGW